MGLGLVTLIAIVTAPWVMPPVRPGLSDELVDETVQLAQIMFPIVVLLGPAWWRRCSRRTASSAPRLRAGALERA